MKDAEDRVFIVDDHPMVREGLTHLLTSAGLAVAGEAACGRDALAHPELLECRLALVDLALGGESGLELIKHLKARGLSVLVYSMHEGANVIRRAFDAGADGYITKRETAQSLMEAVRSVLSGQRYLSPRVESSLEAMTSSEGLSGQQQQIYQLLGQGCSNEEIAKCLNISGRTLESYCVRIIDKLGLKGIKELRRQAIRGASSSESAMGPDSAV